MSFDELSPGEVERLRAAPYTYTEVGATYGVLPAGYHHLRVSRDVGRGGDRFEGAAELLRSWAMHRRAGITVRASGPVADGAVAVLGIGVGPLRIHAPVRVVEVVDEERRRGFVYGTLPGHPETGEERFVVEMDDAERVRFEITAFSRPATPLMRAVGPLGRGAQGVITRRYLATVGR